MLTRRDTVLKSAMTKACTESGSCYWLRQEKPAQLASCHTAIIAT